MWEVNAQWHFVVGGLLIGFSKSNSPKVRRMSESGRIIPLKKRIWGKLNWKTKKRRVVHIQRPKTTL